MVTVIFSITTSLFCFLRRRPSGKFDIDDIDAHLCTHLNYGFANMDNQTWKLVAYDPWSVLLLVHIKVPVDVS